MIGLAAIFSICCRGVASFASIISTGEFEEAGEYAGAARGDFGGSALARGRTDRGAPVRRAAAPGGTPSGTVKPLSKRPPRRVASVAPTASRPQVGARVAVAQHGRGAPWH